MRVLPLLSPLIPLAIAAATLWLHQATTGPATSRQGRDAGRQSTARAFPLYDTRPAPYTGPLRLTSNSKLSIRIGRGRDAVRATLPVLRGQAETDGAGRIESLEAQADLHELRLRSTPGFFDRLRKAGFAHRLGIARFSGIASGESGRRRNAYALDTTGIHSLASITHRERNRLCVAALGHGVTRVTGQSTLAPTPDAGRDQAMVLTWDLEFERAAQ